MEASMVVRIDRGAIKFGLSGLLLGLAVSWAFGARGAQDGGARIEGQTAVPKPSAGRSSETTKPQGGARALAGGDSGGTLALITSSSNGPAQWLYLIDTKDRSFALYRIDPANPKGIVKLEASRQYRWDLKLEHYNNQAPEPDAIKATVETLARSAGQ
jgi:hypothetical protein